MKKQILSGIFALAVAGYGVNTSLSAQKSALSQLMLNFIKLAIMQIIVCIIAISCSSIGSKSEVLGKSEQTIEIDITKAEAYDVSQFAVPVKYIPLETNSESLIKEISNLFINDRYILIFDKISSTLLLFNIEGKFIRKIGERGNGPGEYLEFNDIYFDVDKDEIYAYERYQDKMYIYSVDGNLIKTISSEFDVSSFTKGEDGFWIYPYTDKNNPGKCNLLYVDKGLKTIKQEYFPQKVFSNTSSDKRFVQDNKINNYFYHPLSTTIYQLDSIAVPYINLDFNSLNPPLDELYKAKTVENYNDIIENREYVACFSNLYFFSDKILFNCSKSGLDRRNTRYIVEANLKKKKSNVYSSMKPQQYGEDTNRLMGVTRGNDLVYSINLDNLSKKQFEKLKQLIPEVEDDSNPILVVYKIKYNNH